MSLRERQTDITHNAILYAYPSGNVDIILSRNPAFRPPGWEAVDKAVEKAKREKGKKSAGEDMARSMRRARANLRRLALSNEFRWFVTLTLDKEKVDRYDPDAILKKLTSWCDNMVRRKGLRYVLVPEQHKDGAWHFHGFFNDAVEAVDSGHQDKGGHRVYNLLQWGLGFSTAIELYGDYAGAVAYVCKYIGKHQGQRPMGRWYYSGGGLKKPPKEWLDLDYVQTLEAFAGEAVEFDIPGNRIAVIRANVDKSKQEEI